MSWKVTDNSLCLFMGNKQSSSERIKQIRAGLVDDNEEIRSHCNQNSRPPKSWFSVCNSICSLIRVEAEKQAVFYFPGDKLILLLLKMTAFIVFFYLNKVLN